MSQTHQQEAQHFENLLNLHWKQYLESVGEIRTKHWEKPKKGGNPLRRKGPTSKKYLSRIKERYHHTGEGTWNWERTLGRSNQKRVESKEIVFLEDAPVRIWKEWRGSKTQDKEVFTTGFVNRVVGVSAEQCMWVLGKITDLERGSLGSVEINNTALFPQEERQTTRGYPHSDIYKNFNEGANRIMKSSAVEMLKTWYQAAATSQSTSSSFFSRDADQALHILNNGKAALADIDYEKADVLLLDTPGLRAHLQREPDDHCIVYRDQEWWNSERPCFNIQDMWASFHERDLINPDFKLDIQDSSLDPNRTGQSVRQMTLNEVKERWKLRGFGSYPINLLNLRVMGKNPMPKPLMETCILLQKAVSIADEIVSGSGPGKITSKIPQACDIASCSDFSICGQAGSFSGWHMDAIGPITYVSLESNGIGQPPPIKLWAVVSTQRLNEDQKTHLWAKFKLEGAGFSPPPETIKIICLTEGDTLIMKPGTIHAPITATDSHFRGGMVYDIRYLPKTFQAWSYIVENDNCTNEDPPSQARQVIPVILQLAEQGQDIKISEVTTKFKLTAKDLAKIRKDADIVAHMSLRCECHKGKMRCVKEKCACWMAGMSCGNRCECYRMCSNPKGVYGSL